MLTHGVPTLGENGKEESSQIYGNKPVALFWELDIIFGCGY